MEREESNINKEIVKGRWKRNRDKEVEKERRKWDNKWDRTEEGENDEERKNETNE